MYGYPQKKKKERDTPKKEELTIIFLNYITFHNLCLSSSGCIGVHSCKCLCIDEKMHTYSQIFFFGGPRHWEKKKSSLSQYIFSLFWLYIAITALFISLISTCYVNASFAVALIFVHFFFTLFIRSQFLCTTNFFFREIIFIIIGLAHNKHRLLHYFCYFFLYIDENFMLLLRLSFNYDDELKITNLKIFLYVSSTKGAIYKNIRCLSYPTYFWQSMETIK